MAWLVAFRPTIILVVPEKYTVQKLSGAADLRFRSSSSQPPRIKAFRSLKTPRQAQKLEPKAAGNGEGVEVLREHARQATVAMMTNFKIRHTYGFSTIDYQLPFQMAGELPTISANELPPRLEQYVIVEVTIDVDGHVADARIVSGEVGSSIQRTLLSAIREFKYRPATRDGTPIPSQVDIVVHVPT